MRLAIVAFLSVLLLQISSAWAFDVPQQWSACKTSADCTVVSSDCGPTSGVNIQYKEKAHSEICKTEDCSHRGCDASAIQAIAATCKNGQCVPDYSLKPPPAPDVQFKVNNLEFRCPPDNPDCGVKSDK